MSLELLRKKEAAVKRTQRPCKDCKAPIFFAKGFMAERSLPFDMSHADDARLDNLGKLWMPSGVSVHKCREVRGEAEISTAPRRRELPASPPDPNAWRTPETKVLASRFERDNGMARGSDVADPDDPIGW